jgi:molybdopterin synthase sulfur carrier subunit
MPELTIRYFAAARAAAGTQRELVRADSVDEALAFVAARHGDRLSAVLAVSSLLLDGVHVDNPAARLASNAELDVLPPFAGG